MKDTKEMTKMALLTALLCISAYISFPLPFTPAQITALTFVMCLIAFLLPPKQTFIVIAVYILLGAVGLPVYVGGTAGLGKLLGPTGGYIWSWPIAYTLLSICKGKTRSIFAYTWRAVLITVPITYIFGMAGLMFVAHMSLQQAFVAGAAPFLLGDTLKAILAAFLATKIRI